MKSKTKTSLSIAIATFNESQNIKKCLDAIVSIADEIVIVDGQSTDNTVSIIKNYSKVKIISTPNRSMFHLNKQMAIDNCSSDWILQLDADEVVTPELSTEISKILQKHPNDIPNNGFWINRKNYFLGRFLTKGGIYPDPTIRFYKKNMGKLPCKNVHEQAEVVGSVGHLQSDLLHFSDPTFSRYLIRQDRYTSLLASELNSPNFITFFLFKPIYWFILSYFFHRGYVDGFPGFIFSIFSSMRFPIAYIKYWEKKHA